ncbi:MAG: hypothetical protein ACFFDN_04140 [Candidatus Hodarchaeota archaeon]
MKKVFVILMIFGFLLIINVLNIDQNSNSLNLPQNISNNSNFQLTSRVSFNPAKNISPINPNNENLNGKIAVDSNNIFHIVYTNFSNGKMICYANSSNFTNTYVVAYKKTNDIRHPAISIGNNDTIYIVWEINNGSQYDIMISNSSDFFNTNYTISFNTSYNDIYPDIKVDSLGIVHVVWAAPNAIGPLQWEIYYTNSSDNFSSYKNISNNPNNDTTPSIDIDSNNVVYVVWAGINVSTYDIYYTNSSDNFQSKAIISSNSWNDQFPDIAISKSEVMIAWSASNGTNYDIVIASNRSSFAKRTISQNPYNDLNPRIINGPGNILHIVWTSYDNMESDIIYCNELDFLINYTLSSNLKNDTQCDIAVDYDGIINIIWVTNNQTQFLNSTYTSPVVINSILIPLDIKNPQKGIIVMGKFSGFGINNVKFRYSTNFGASWITLKMSGSGNSYYWRGTAVFVYYKYEKTLLYKFGISDKVNPQFETANNFFYFPETRFENIITVIIIFSLLGVFTIISILPPIRRFLIKSFKQKDSEKLNIKAKESNN